MRLVSTLSPSIRSSAPASLSSTALAVRSSALSAEASDSSFLVPNLLPPAPKGFALHRRGASQRTGMAAVRHLRSGLPLTRGHLAASESAVQI
ncbi:hypothetical protein PVAP13_4KG033100 [Panicum virgatum]|uniref:Uncharacterized protein n=1 Tax=Panicum virgatum TaxID=38727 RepID=A0A8T0TJT8_PANVG|nr:hypothetical protein PVAP13_4KG033100 [Panicum virgatum]